jgi:lipocalin
MIRTRKLGFVAALSLLAVGCATNASGALPGAGPLTVVESFELPRYLGTWYEIAKYPVSFEEGLVGVQADYSLRGDGDVRVVNSGYRETFDGERSTAEGRAWVPDPSEPAKLRVRFFWPFHAPYWVIALDPRYEWAVVGDPGRRYLWILSRSKTMPDELYTEIVDRIHDLGYDTSRLEKMPQRREDLP